ncbi:MAG TPA: CehA/McbA family metallohydrolase [Candidatus Aminicenantes bacterium]|nr:CehA/McbA family metallohydrolase [Candidatus Aminicenantes bacterium]
MNFRSGFLGLLLTLAWTVLPAQELRWFKGNMHTHTVHSDGDEQPARVVRWYRDHEYNFLVLTDHNELTPVATLDTDERDGFLLIPGEEVTVRFNNRPAHQNGLGIRTQVPAVVGRDMVETYQLNANALRAAGGLVQLNHPNWRYAVSAAEIVRLQGIRLLEVWNASGDTNNTPAGGHPGTEEIWDQVLSAGRVMYATASDDMHNLLGDYSASKANPGHGWVVVRARELSQAAILQALTAGDFYASTGIVLDDLRVNEGEYTVRIHPTGEETAYTTTFVGRDGKVLATVFGREATYRIRGDEGYVRARIHDSNGNLAFCQPFFPTGLQKTGLQ